MAASTREKDKETFFRQLIYPPCDSIPLQRLMLYCLELHKRPEWNNVPWYIDIFRDNENNAGLIDAIVIGWTASSIDECNEIVDRLFTIKEAWYARHYLAQLIFALRHGDTKRRAANVEHIGAFKNILTAHWKDEFGPLGYLVRAWKCFESSFDFGSALHAAVELPGDMHINCILVGALADAMYGHQQYFRKQKYGGGVQNLDIQLLDDLRDIDRDTWCNRTFFPKNNACTNVERHNWFPVHEHMYSGVHFSQEARRRMLKSFYTSWDNRFGLYWDDGWFYMYRSSFLLGRFRLSENSDGTYSIAHLQETKDNENLDIDTVLREVIDPTLRGWSLFGDEDTKTTLLHMFKFYHGEEEAPYEVGNQHGKWWLWEKMVWEHFEEGSLTKISDWGCPAPDFLQKEFSGFCSEECRMLDFFLNMHAKWIPYYDAVEALKEEYIKY